MIKKASAWGLVLLVVLSSAFVGGAYLESKGRGPVDALRKLKAHISPASSQSPLAPKFDGFGRLVFFPGKVETKCPAQTAKTQVLLLIGQSNAANHAGQRYSSNFGGRVVNYFNGKCYEAASPLLGAGGLMGESWVLLANKMISNGLADNVVLLPSAIASTAIAQWSKGGELNRMLTSVVDQVGPEYKITRVIWHQGESDFIKARTSTDAYKDHFQSLLTTLREHGVAAPIYVSIASVGESYDSWSPDNPTATAQRQLPDNKKGILKGVDTDQLVTFRDRYDGTHFSSSGQEKFTDALIKIFQEEK